MRIGIDAACWSNKRGYGRYARSLLKALLALDRQNAYIFFTDSTKQAFELPKSVEVVRVPTIVPILNAASSDSHRSLADLWTMSRVVARQQFDLFFFPCVYTYFPILARVPKLVTIHDTFSELFPNLIFPTRRARFFWRAKIGAARWQADFILTVSDYSRRCLTQYLGISPSRIRVVGEGSEPLFKPLRSAEANGLLGRFGLTSGHQFLLYVGGFSPHKNLLLLLDVFREIVSGPRFRELRLVLVGDYAEDSFYSCYGELREMVTQRGLDQRVVFTGYVPDETLVHLFNLARALVLPSQCEGFGLPAIEAAACGTPVVATTASPLPELLGEAGLFVAPADRPGLFAALIRVLTEEGLRQKMREAALRALSSLTWENAARQLLAVFEEVAGTRHAETA